MIITFKTLQQKTFKIEIDENEKVKALKEKIEKEKGSDFPLDGQKLIYAGKILDDDKTISEYNIDTVKNFVVVMAVKNKSKPADKKETGESSAATPSTDASSTTTTTSATPATQTPSTAAASVTTAQTTATTTTTPASSTPTTGVESAESTLLTGSALETSITELMSLGFSREQVMQALNSSFHNADRAAEYLLSGTIPVIGADDLPPEGGEDDVPAALSEAPPLPSSGGVADISFLASLPQFQLMRNQVRQHPESLPQLLQEIGQANPQLLQLISQNQQSFINLLNAPENPAAGEGPVVGGGGVGGGNGGGGGAGGGYQIQVTQEEKAAIDRIVAMGFAEPEVIQAFFACEKNEQLTINFLLN